MIQPLLFILGKKDESCDVHSECQHVYITSKARCTYANYLFGIFVAHFKRVARPTHNNLSYG